MKTPFFPRCNGRNGDFLFGGSVATALQVLRSVYVGAAGGASAEDDITVFMMCIIEHNRFLCYYIRADMYFYNLGD